MKKNGFTLAEVLITLAIIGVVATMTLPNLITNTGEQQYKTGLKKGINTLTEAAQMSDAIDGVSFSDLTSNDIAISDISEAASLYALLATRTTMDFGRSKKKALKIDGAEVANNMTIFFRDGSALSYDPSKTMKDATVSGNNTVNTPMDDGLSYGIPAVFDTNGTKGPNLLSYCADGTAANDALTDSEDLNTRCDKKSRVIKDQFGVRLRDAYAVPNGAAAQWAYNN